MIKNTECFYNNEPFDTYFLWLYQNKCSLTHLTLKKLDGLGFILPFLYDYRPIYISIYYINLILIYIHMNLFVEKKKNVKILKHLLTV